jgi:hypothetical protein
MKPYEPIPIQEIKDTKARIKGTAIRTPLVRLNVEDVPAEIKDSSSTWYFNFDGGGFMGWRLRNYSESGRAFAVRSCSHCGNRLKIPVGPNNLSESTVTYRNRYSAIPFGRNDTYFIH